MGYFLININNQWKENYYNPQKNKLIDFMGNIKANEYLANLYERFNNEGNIENTYILLNEIGISVTKEELKQLQSVGIKRRRKESNYSDLFIDDISPIIRNYFEGNNPYEVGKEETKILSKAAYSLAQVRLDSQESSHSSVDNCILYSHIVTFFIPKQIKALKNKEVREKYLNTPFYSHMPWLNEMHDAKYNNTSFYKNEFKYAILDGKKWDNEGVGKSYNKMSKKDLELVRLNAFLSGEQTVWYQMPTLADAPTGIFIKGQKRNGKDILDSLYDVALSEWARIEASSTIKDIIREDITNYAERASQFHFIPELNAHKALFKKGDKKAIIKIIRKYLDRKTEETIDNYIKLGIIMETNGRLYPIDISIPSGGLRPTITEYVWNDILAETQMISLFQGDPAFYISNAKMKESSKELLIQGTLLDTTANFILNTKNLNGQKRITDKLVVRANFSAIFLSKESLNIELFHKELYDLSLANGEYESFVNKLVLNIKTNNITTGFITLKRYRELCIGMAKWSLIHNIEYSKLQNGMYSKCLEPFETLLFTHYLSTDNVIIPITSKNLEFILLPAMAYLNKKDKIVSPNIHDRSRNYTDYKSPILAKLLDVMQRDSYEDDDFIDSALLISEDFAINGIPLTSIETDNDTKVYFFNNSDFSILTFESN